IEIEIFEEGTMEKLLIAEGDKVPVGTVIAIINPAAGSAETKKEIRVKASPLAKRMAAGSNIDLSLIKGTGPEGAITKDDVEKAIVKHDEPEKPETPKKIVEKTIEAKKEKTASFNKTIRDAIAAAMSKSNREIPHYYLEKMINMSNAMEWLQETNLKRPIQKRLLPISLLVKAVAQSLKDVPELNAVWENGLQLKNEINIGFVVALRTGGIVIPTIQQAAIKTIDEIMEALNDIIPRAKALKLRSSELSNTTITMTNLGEGSADKVFGVIYPPQVAIIGFGSVLEQPIAENGMIGIRPVVYVTLAGDHRATDGLSGSRFLDALNNYLQKPEIW
ncbi:dihydrolipoamide acetyltransferase family protein, partial [Lutibacter sp.]|uniref:dihydrolipoamide acetyltransferase family protein n=1 Tax=Lutibacter sp. TaxID=1925666 RepID=UPI003567E46B